MYYKPSVIIVDMTCTLGHTKFQLHLFEIDVWLLYLRCPSIHIALILQENVGELGPAVPVQHNLLVQAEKKMFSYLVIYHPFCLNALQPVPSSSLVFPLPRPRCSRRCWRDGTRQ